MNAIRLPRALPWIVVALIPLSGGCLNYEEMEQRAVVGEDKIVRLTQTFHNFCGEKSEDFRELVEAWKGDQFLVEAAERNSYVVSRKLWLEKGVLMGSVEQLGHAANLLNDDGWRTDSTGYLQSIDTSRVDIVSTNGSLTFADSVLAVRWPPTARELIIRTKARQFQPTGNFPDSFRAYLREEKRHR